ncbi:MAG: ABC transporter substrate-binding protein [Chloroflexi bacterium]|nr:ABC transporter substrate-binding protein [Chloroflexota bacterium]
MRPWQWLPVAAALATVLAACVPAAQAPAEKPAAEQPVAEYGGVLNLALSTEPATLDLHADNTSTPVFPIYNPLVRYDPLEALMSKVEPNLAERWEISPDGKTYTFHLIKGVKFHQGGEFTASDAAFSFERQKNPQKGQVAPRKAAFDPVDRFEVVDDYTLRVHMKRLYASFLANIAQGWMAMLDKEWVEAGHDPTKELNGTGPFTWKEYIRGTSVEQVKNPNYWKKGLPYLDGVKYFFIPDEGTLLAAFRTGNLHISGSALNLAQQGDVTSALGDKVRSEKRPVYYGNSLVNLSTAKKPFDDVRVRRALSYAIDREAGIKVLWEGQGYNQGYMPGKGPWGLPPEELAKFPGFSGDPEKNRAEAKRLLAEAGYPNGFNVAMNVRKQTGREQVNIFVQDQWKRIGVIGTLKTYETAVSYELLRSGDYEVFEWGTAYAFDDPDAIYAEHFTCKAERNYAHLCIPEVDALFEKQSAELDLAKRKKLVNEMEKAALDAMPRIIIPAGDNTATGIWNTVRNWRLQPSPYGNRHWEQTWLAK